jgi:methylmalonyl-CoA mutase N-terminal domain/subunit
VEVIKNKFSTSSGINIPEFLNTSEIPEDPEIYPYTRGIHKSMYRKKLWTMRQYAGFGNAEESNKRYKFLTSSGTTGLSVAFDLPTQIGYDSDDPISEGEVGKVGVAIDSLEDMEKLFDGISLEKVSTSMTINSTASILLLMYYSLAKKQNSDLKKITGTIQNDILKEYIARGTYIYPPKQSMKLVTDIFEWCSENLPQWNVISVSGYHIREAGSTAVQEIAFTLANGIEYINHAVNSGLNIDSFAKRISFFFNSHNDFFEEIAKFRAARRIWSKLLKEKYNLKDENSLKLRFHAQTGGSTLTDKQIENNISRVTLQALAAVLGGCQSLHTNGKDEALSLPSEESALTALRTQQIIAFESKAADSVDPLGGSPFIEYLTDEIEAKAFEYINEIEKLGGSLKALENGYQQSEIEKSSYDFQKSLESGESIIVGINKFQNDETEEYQYQEINNDIRENQIKNLNQLKKRRDNSKVKSTLDRISNKALTDENLLPFMLDAIECYATIGEISNTLRNIWGEYGKSA